MINISQKCLQALKEDAVQHAEIKARLINGKTLTLTDEDLILNGLEVENHAVCGEQLEVGSMTAAVLKLTLNNEDGRFNDIFFAGAELTVNLLIPLGDGTSYTIPYGVYTIDEQPRTWSTIEIEAYDNMVKLDIPFNKTQVQTPATLRDIVHAGIDASGLSCADYSMFPNGENNIDVLKIQSENPITWRQVLMWCCQCAGVCGFADGNGYILFGFYQKYTPDILQTESAENLETESEDLLFTDGAAADDFPLPPSLRFIDDMHLDESDCILTGHQFKVGELLYPADAVMDYGILTENNLVFAAADASARDNFADTVNKLLAGFTYRPYACNILSMPQLQLLDGVDYDENGQHHHSIVTNYTFRLNGFMNIEAKAKSQVQKGWASLGALTPGQQAIIDSVSQKVDRTRDQLSSYESALLLFNEKMMHSMGLYKTVKDDPNGGIITYFHNMETLENSDTIYMFAASGFAWTTDGWNKGDPVWHYGFTDTGDAILNTIHAYKLSAELIETGYLRSQNGASWINMDDGTFCFRSATPDGLDADTLKPMYTYEKVLELANKQLNVYGTLRNLQYPSFSVSVGPSAETESYAAFTVSNSVSDYGNILQISPWRWYNKSDPSTTTDRGVGIMVPFLGTQEGSRQGIQFNSSESMLKNEKPLGSALLYGSNAWISAFRDNINISTSASHQHCWFNYFQPKHGYSPIAYDFGNGAGGHSDIYCADIYCADCCSDRLFLRCDTIYGDSIINADGDATILGSMFVGGNSGNENCKLNVNGAAGATSWVTISDPSLKKNIIEQTEVGTLKKLLDMKFYSYDFKNGSAHIKYGTMANDAPTEIQTEDGKGIELYSYIGFTAKSVQELNEKCEEQATKITNLESRIEKLEILLANLEQR